MALTGIDPFDPTPAVRREYIFGAGPSLGQAPDRPVLLVGNKTSAGTETVDVISSDPIADDLDAKNRLGERSELYAMYRAFTAVPQDATIYALAATESGGSAASVELSVTNNSDSSYGWKFHVHGVEFEYNPVSGDEEQTTAEGIAEAFNNADNGCLQVTAVAAVDGAGPAYKVTITAAQIGPRGDLIIGATANRGIRVTSLGTNAQLVAKETSTYAAGATEDDHTAAIAEIANGEYYYQVTAKHATSGPTATDNGIGEHLAMIKAQALPANAKDQRLFVGLVGTQAQAVTVATDSDCNSVYAHFFWQENSDWTPAMIAAHCCAVVRQQEMLHPGANINGWSASDTKVFQIPKPYLKADYPTAAEIKACLNNGVSPIAYRKNRVELVRFITSKSLGDGGDNDYRAREGHIPSVAHFFWSILSQRYAVIRQPFAADDPTGNNPPPARCTTPGAIRAMVEGVIDDLCSDAPLGGVYNGPILDPDKKQAMKAAIQVTYAGGGSFPTRVDHAAVVHNIKLEVTDNEVSAAY